MPTKQGVVAQYETQITRFFRGKGYRCESVFPKLNHDERFSCDSMSSDDTLSKWAQLIEIGFPFVKAHVLTAAKDTVNIERHIPKKYRQRPG